MQTSTQYAIERLTETHTVHHDGQQFECDPLLDQLRAARTSSIGAGSGGGSGDGGLINFAAYTLWETIDGAARSMLHRFHRDHKGELADVIRRLPAAIQAEHASGMIDGDEREHLEARFAQWVALIEDLFDPPRQKELTAPCPDCEQRYFLIEEHDQHGNVTDTKMQAAVIIPVKVGRALVAECRCCGALWATEGALTDLADRMGIEVDFVALREFTRNPQIA